MTVLGIETATMICGVGIASGEGMVADYKILRKYAHAEVLPGAVERVLRDASLNGDDLNGIAVSIGPGSFTGLRIGLGLAKGLALGWDKPLVAVPTMEGLVGILPPVYRWVCVLLHARKGEVYRGLYCWINNVWMPQGKIDSIQVDDIHTGLPDEKIFFVGEGADLHRSTIESKRAHARFLPESRTLQSGYGVASKGREYFLSGKKDDIASLAPLYLKRFQGVA